MMNWFRTRKYLEEDDVYINPQAISYIEESYHNTIIHFTGSKKTLEVEDSARSIIRAIDNMELHDEISKEESDDK